jgi:hypothetical protein
MTAAIEVLPPIQPPQGLIAHCGSKLVGRQELIGLHTPEGSDTHKPIPHERVVGALIETLGFRNLQVVQDGYALSPDGMRCFGVLALDMTGDGVRVSIAVRNSHDKSFSLGLTCGYRVFCCDNMAFNGDFLSLTRKHSKNLIIEDVFSVAVDRMARQFAPMLNQVDAWRGFQLTDANAKLIIYQAFIEQALEVPKHLADDVHHHYFEPEYDEFKPRTLWSLSNAFTSAMKQLDPIPQFRATAKLAPFLAQFEH